MSQEQEFYVTILDGIGRDLIVNLGSFQKSTVSFGRRQENDIVLNSSIVSRYHGCFSFHGECWSIIDGNSTNGLTWNGAPIKQKQLMGGDKILIGNTSDDDKVVFVFSHKDPHSVYSKLLLTGRSEVTIGRDLDCDIVVDSISVLRNHCRIVSEGDAFYLEREKPGAAVQYNGENLRSKTRLQDSDRFLVGDTQFVYMYQELYYIRIAGGLGFEVSHLIKTVGKGKTILDNVNFRVNEGEFLAIIGGSGAGKSTLLNCLCGCSNITAGHVIVGGEDLTANYGSLKQLIGYVPQQDIVYDDLTLETMLRYTAMLRMPDDATEDEIERRIDRAIEMVELSERRYLPVKKLSGGQKKRASIAVELLSDPKLFFLDEPTSGLDPGTERNLMMTLKGLSKMGKTVVLVTHNPLNLNLCDKIVVMGTGGRLCFCGSSEEALAFFRVENLVDIYDKINTDAGFWSEKYQLRQEDEPSLDDGTGILLAKDGNRKSLLSSMRQMRVLVSRNIALHVNDTRRLLIQLLMAPGLGLLLYIAFREGYPFKASYDTQKLALTLACCAFWIGLFNSIQEICKETQIYLRERMSNLRLFPYVGSKMLVNAALDLIQTALLLLVVGSLLGMPEEGMQFKSWPKLEIFLTTYLTMFSASSLGLAVSAFVDNPDQAISVAPVLLIPQILFSGIIVDLKGIIEKISYLISCRYACVAYCTTADVNSLPSEYTLTGLGLEEGEVVILDSMYSYTGNISETAESLFGESFAKSYTNPIMGGWLMLLLLSFVCMTAAAIVLKQKSRIK